MSDEAQREMSLDEYLDQLPPSHRARKELDSFLAAKNARIKELEGWQEIVRDGCHPDIDGEEAEEWLIADALRQHADLRPLRQEVEDKDARIKELRYVLVKVMSWISNWSPRFTEEDEWDETKAEFDAVLDDHEPQTEEKTDE